LPTDVQELPDCELKEKLVAWHGLLSRYEQARDQLKEIIPIEIHLHAVCEYGNAVYSVVALDRTFSEVYQQVETSKHETNGNTALYRALLIALRMIEKHSWSRIQIVTCNKLLAGQMRGEMECNAASLVPLKEEAVSLLEKLDGIRIEYRPKDENRAATLAWNEFNKQAG